MYSLNDVSQGYKAIYRASTSTTYQRLKNKRNFITIDNTKIPFYTNL